MRKFNLLMIFVLAISLLGTMAFAQVSAVSAQDAGHVGVVVEYVPGQSITIVDQGGGQHEFQLAPSLKILPPAHAGSLDVGSFITIIAPNSISSSGKQLAVGIVIHPHVPNGWNIPAVSGTPLAASTVVGTVTASPTGTILATETAAVIVTTTTTATFTATATPTATPLGGSPATPTDESFIQWLTSLIRQVLGGR